MGELGEPEDLSQQKNAGWAQLILSDICDPDRRITYGIVQPGQLHAEGVPIVRVNNFRGNGLDLTDRLAVAPDIEEKYARSRPRPGDLLVSLVGTIGQLAIAPAEIEGWNLARAVGLIPFANKLTAEWAFYSLQTSAAQDFINQRANTTVQTTFNLKDLARIPIFLPPEWEQRQILSILKTLDDKIELNCQINQTLEALARAVFEDWFVAFGPTRRKVAGETDPAAILGGLLPPYAAAPLSPIFPNQFGDYGLPMGWKERPFVEFIDIIGGGTPKTGNPEYWGGDIPWFSVVDTPPTGGVFVWDTEKTITERGVSKSSARMIPEGTTIISARGTVGNIAMAGRPMTFNQSCYGLSALGPVGDIFVYLATERMVDRLKAMAHGSVFSTITRSTFQSLNFAWAGKTLFMAFEAFATPVFEQIKANGKENRALGVTRDLLLPKLMSGELRLKDAEAAI